jgi:hypothetical protein
MAMAPQSPAPAQEQQGGDLSQLMEGAMQMLTQIGQALQAQGAPPEKMKQIAALARAFQMFASGEADKPQAGARGAVPMEAGANPNARPAL